jgi:hypothetical protein
MKYLVEAHLIPSRSAELYRRLTDGSIAGQEPDGREIVASMQRARVTAEGVVRWTETCYCPTPLQHERETVYDRYFTDLSTEVIDEPPQLEGEPLMPALAATAASAGAQPPPS